MEKYLGFQNISLDGAGKFLGFQQNKLGLRRNFQVFKNYLGWSVQSLELKAPRNESAKEGGDGDGGHSHLLLPGSLLLC